MTHFYEFSIVVAHNGSEWRLSGTSEVETQWRPAFMGWPGANVPVCLRYQIDAVEPLMDGSDEDIIPRRRDHRLPNPTHIKPVIEQAIRLIEYRHWFRQHCDEAIRSTIATVWENECKAATESREL